MYGVRIESSELTVRELVRILPGSVQVGLGGAVHPGVATAAGVVALAMSAALT
jgi:hypothetical protein